MADVKDKDAAATPAPHTQGEEVSTDPSQYSTKVPDLPASQKTDTYYLREGKIHHHIDKGELVTLDSFGDPAVLTAEQYASFQDKFLTKPEYTAAKAGKEALASTTLSPGEEATSPEAANAALNPPDKK